MATRTLLILAFVCATACQEPRRSTKILPPSTTLVQPSQSYYRAAPGCAAQEQMLNLEEGIIYTLQGSSQKPYLTSQLTPLKTRNISSWRSLISPLIGSVSYDAVYHRDCPNRLAEEGCFEGNRYIDWSVVDDGMALPVCDKVSDYPRDSYEGIGLTTIYDLETVLEMFRKAYKKPIRPIALEVMPRYISTYENEATSRGQAIRLNTYFTHNLAYFPFRDKIVVFPESRDEETLYRELGHLWESPFGVGHEAGHHLEHMILQDNDLFTDQVLWRPDRHLYAPRRLAEGRQNKLASVKSALSEGFADLAAFYALLGESEHIHVLHRLGENRDPAHPHFQSSDRRFYKQLTEATAKKLFGLPCDDDCAPDNYFFRPHDVGAVLAHALHELIGVLEKTAPPPDDSASLYERRLTWVIKWFEMSSRQLKFGATDGGNSTTTLLRPLARGINDFVDALTASGEVVASAELEAELCQVARKTLPYLVSQLTFCD